MQVALAHRCWTALVDVCAPALRVRVRVKVWSKRLSITADGGELGRFERSPAGYGHRSSEKPGDLLDVRKLWKRLYSHRRLTLSVFAATMLAGLLYLLIAPPVYTAVSVIHVDPRQQRAIASETDLSGTGADAAAVESQIELIRSTAVASTVVEQLGLLHDPEFSRPSLLARALETVLPAWGDEDPVAAARRHRNMVIVRLLEQLSVRRRGLTYLIEIRFDSVDAEKAALIANALAGAYLDDQLATKSNTAKWLTERIDKLRGRLSDSERAVAAYKAENNMIDAGTESSVLTLINQQIEQSNRQLILARTLAVEANAKYDRFRRLTEQNVDPGSLSDALNSDVLSDLRVQYTAVARLESEYSVTLGPSHPSLQRTRSKLATMRREIKQELARILVSKKDEHELAIARVDSLAASLKALEQKSLQFDLAKIRFADLQREAQANRELFGQFLSRAKQRSERRSLTNSEARVVARAIMPDEPGSPGKMIVLLIAAVSGMGLAVGSTFLRQNLDRGYRAKADLERDTGVMCLGLCPAVDPRNAGGVATKGRNRSWRSLTRLMNGFASGGAIGKKTGFRQLASRIVLDQPASSYADAIRSIQFNCKKANPDRQSKIYLVSSALPGEGKSTLAVNLARSLAKSGVCTLLIDADTRTGSLSQVLARNDAPGLSEVISNQQTFRETAICEPETTMFFLPAGRNRLNGGKTGMLADDRFRQFLDKYRDSFEYIVIDGSPVLSTENGRILYRYADAALFVVEWGKTDNKAVIAAMETLGSMQRKIVGTILNKVDPFASDATRDDNSVSRS